MNLYLIGHDYRYAAEQMLLTLFPDERPVVTNTRPSGKGPFRAGFFMPPQS